MQRMLANLRRSIEALAEEVQPLDGGWVARTRSLPLVWALNQLCITEPRTAEEVVQLADRLQADLPYRHVVVEEPGTATELAGALAGAGWAVEREVFMVLEGSPDREPAAHPIVDLDERHMTDLMRRWLTEERTGAAPDELEQVTEYNRREGRLWNERLLGVLGPDGAPLAITKFRSDGPDAWVEDVYTVVEARRRGYARALVTRAVELARAGGHDFVFIIADDEDWPKDLYAKIGFRPAGTVRIFHRDLEGTG